MVHLLRSFGPSPSWSRLDDITRITCEGFLGDLDSDQWELATLPLRDGGLGLRRADPFASIAFAAADRACKGVANALLPSVTMPDNSAASIESCVTLQRFPNARTSILESLRRAGDKCPSSDAKEQKEWSDVLMADLHTAWRARPNLDPLLAARSISASGPLASAWLTGVGCDEQHIPWIGRDEFSVLISLRFARPVFAEDTRCALCSTPMDQFGHHALTCMSGGHRTMVHHDVVDAFYHLASAALLHPQKEQYPFLPPHDRLRVDLKFRQSSRRPVFLDVAVTHPFGTVRGIQTVLANPPGTWAEQYARDNKNNKYILPTAAVDGKFVPLVVDTAGAWCEGAKDTFARLGRRLQVHYRYEKNYCSQLAAAHVAIILQRGLARLVLLHVGPSRGRRVASAE